MRRFFSILLLILGGWMLVTEAFIAGLALDSDGDAKLAIVATFTLLALVFLLIGAWVSPGRRWREVGLTLLICAGLATLTALSIVAMNRDRADLEKALGRPFPDLAFDPLLGIANLLLIAGLGYWLWRRPAEAAARP